MNRASSLGDKKKLIYVSRTHMQLDQVAKEIKKLPFNFSMSFKASRLHLCMKTSLTSLSNDACTKK